MAIAVAVPCAAASPMGPAHAVDPGPSKVPVICSTTENYTKFNTFGATRRITHAKYVGVPAGAHYNQTTGVQSVAQLSSSVTVSSGVTVSADAVVSAMEVKAGVDLQTVGSRTSTASESVVWDFDPGRYAAFRGYKYFTGSWTAYRCALNGTKDQFTYGSATNYAVPGEGAALCNVTYAAGSFEALAKTIAC